MLVKEIPYTDYDGEEQTFTACFHLKKSDLLKWELSEQGGLRARLEKIIASKDVPAIAQIFEEIIEKSYGVKSPDGKRFIQNKEVFEEFAETEAYSNFYMELATDEKAANAFIKAIIPKDINVNEAK